MVDWTQPWFAPWREPGEAVAGAIARGRCQHEALNGAGAPVRFVAASALPEGEAYERFIFERAAPAGQAFHSAAGAWHPRLVARQPELFLL